MRPTRRKTLLGMGALATGSGAVFSSAAFQNSVSPGSDLRVIVDEQLRVEPGILFRDGENAADAFSAGNNVTSVSYNGDSVTVKNQSTSSLFGGQSSDGLENIDSDDVPAVAINNKINGDLSLEMAVDYQKNNQIGSTSAGVLQIQNETGTSQEVAIRYEDANGTAFGEDVGSGNREISASQVVKIFEFYDSSGNKISPTDDSPGTTPQTVANTVSISSGSTEQIYVKYNALEHRLDLLKAANNSSTGTNGSFTESTDTIQLVKSISIGTSPDSGNVQ